MDTITNRGLTMGETVRILQKWLPAQSAAGAPASERALDATMYRDSKAGTPGQKAPESTLENEYGHRRFDPEVVKTFIVDQYPPVVQSLIIEAIGAACEAWEKWSGEGGAP